MTKLEQCARAVYFWGADNGTPEEDAQWAHVRPATKEIVYRQALAVIEALYEPSEEMLRAGGFDLTVDSGLAGAAIKAQYQAMLNTIRLARDDNPA